MTEPAERTPETMTDDELVAHIKELREIVQAVFDSTTPEDDQLQGDASRAKLELANKIARERNVDVPPGR